MREVLSLVCIHVGIVCARVFANMTRLFVARTIIQLI